MSNAKVRKRRRRRRQKSAATDAAIARIVGRLTTPVTDAGIDKSAWGPGPWQSESDRKEWVHMGYHCAMQRHDTWGHWCGYVVVPKGHPWYGKNRNEIDASVHGGLTADGPAARHPGHWVVGFDCAHAFDFCPGREALVKSLTGIWLASLEQHQELLPYCDEPSVTAEVESLAEQAKAAWRRLS